MNETLTDIASSLASSSAHDGVVYLLSNVPGLPPIVQTIHLLAIATIMGSIVILDLRVLGVAVHGQQPHDLARRLLPWTWWAIPVLAISGLVFVLARPRRYLTNPIFGIKFVLLSVALIVTFVLSRLMAKLDTAADRTGALEKVVAAVSLLLWLSVVMAGRWIAYSDYIFPEE
jgi:Family of unknown function (DUF6644)